MTVDKRSAEENGSHILTACFNTRGNRGSLLREDELVSRCREDAPRRSKLGFKAGIKQSRRSKLGFKAVIKQNRRSELQFKAVIKQNRRPKLGFKAVSKQNRRSVPCFKAVITQNRRFELRF